MSNIVHRIDEAIGSKFLRHVKWEYAVDGFFHQYDQIGHMGDEKKNKAAQKALAHYKKMENNLQSFIDGMKEFEKLADQAKREHYVLAKKGQLK